MQNVMGQELELPSNIRMEKKFELCDFNIGMDVRTRWAGLRILERFLRNCAHTQQSLEFIQNRVKKHL